MTACPKYKFGVIDAFFYSRLNKPRNILLQFNRYIHGKINETDARFGPFCPSQWQWHHITSNLFWFNRSGRVQIPTGHITKWCHSLEWRHDEYDGVSNHQPRDFLPNRLFGGISKIKSKLCVTGLSDGNSPVTGEFPAQRASYAENVSIWWRHHDYIKKNDTSLTQ